MNDLIVYAAGVGSTPLIYGASKTAIMRLRRDSKPNFEARAGVYTDDLGKEGVLVWVTALKDASSFPVRAKNRIDWNERGSYAWEEKAYRIMGFVPSDDPDAEEKTLELIIEAQQCAKDWENKFIPEAQELLDVAKRALSR